MFDFSSFRNNINFKSVVQVTTLLAAIDGVINIINKVGKSVPYKSLQAVKPASLVEFTKLARVEPLTVISKDLLTVEYMPDIMQSLLNIFVGYYLQAVAITASIDSVRVIKVLDRLNPDRDPGMVDVIGFAKDRATNGLGFESHDDNFYLSEENYRFKLPRTNIALEAGYPKTSSTIVQDNDKPITDFTKTQHYNTKDNSNTIINEAVNLAVGKYIDVTITAAPTMVSTNSDKSKVENVPITLKIPVNVRLAPVVVPDFTIDHILTIKRTDNTFVERYHSWRSGRISFIKDLIFCQDMIDAHKKALISDETGTYAEIMRRVSNSTKKGVLTQNPSLSSASNIFIISDEIAKNVEAKLGGKLSNARIRQKAFENTYAMIIAVVDRRFERVIFYYRGIETSTNVSIREIRASNKSKGPDILDVFKALNSGNAASF